MTFVDKDIWDLIRRSLHLNLLILMVYSMHIFDCYVLYIEAWVVLLIISCFCRSALSVDDAVKT